MMTTAAAPSLRGQALPAVMVPSGRKTGLRLARRLRAWCRAEGRRLGADDRAVGGGDRGDLVAQKPFSSDGPRPGSGTDGELVLLLDGETDDLATFSAVWPMAM
jgi:hypothetical protein